MRKTTQQANDPPDILPFYNAQGIAICYLYGGTHFYLYDGRPVGYLHANEHAYGYNGRWLGWVMNGWLWDRQGASALFSRFASGGPVRPLRKVLPTRAVRKVRPMRSMRETRPVRPLRRSVWSTVSGESYFHQ